MEELLTDQSLVSAGRRRPKVGFAGLGWIGKNRMEAVAQADLVDIRAVADPLAETLRNLGEFPQALTQAESFERMLDCDLDAVVIATPSALHAQQTVEALEKGMAVFCQKPLGRTAGETRRAVETARRKNRLLGVDFSYRYVTAVREIYRRLHEGRIGDVYAARLVFHNAYGPDKKWFYQPELSGGGCVIDLGVHLVDLALWMLDGPGVSRCSSRLYARGIPFRGQSGRVEDYATAQLWTDTDAVMDLSCSWNLSAGRDAVIEADFIGTQGTLALRNIAGSFYDFAAYEFHGPKEEIISDQPDAWGGRAAVQWARRLVESASYDPSVESIVRVAEVIDRIYDR